MDCDAYREAISAGIDGEDLGVEAQAVEAHLSTCPMCASWAATAMALTRAARVGMAETVPDLSAAIMVAAAPPTPARIVSRLAGRGVDAHPGPIVVARLGLFMVAVAQLIAAIPALLGNDAGASVHVAHDQGSWALSLVVGLLVVAWRPGRAASLLPVVAALTAGLAVTMMVDISAGRTQAAAEAPHFLAYLGLGLLWVLSRLARPGRGKAHSAGRAASVA